MVNLRCKCEFWYVLGYKLCKLMEVKEISLWMEKSLQARNDEIIDQAHSSMKSDKFERFRSYLCHIEQRLLDQKHDTERYMHRWRNQGRSRS